MEFNFCYLNIDEKSFFFLFQSLLLNKSEIFSIDFELDENSPFDQFS